MSTRKRFTRSRTERMIGGVCGGIADYFDLDPTLVRLVFVLLVLVGVGSPILLYLILWVIMPPDRSVRIQEAETGVSLAGVDDLEPDRLASEPLPQVADAKQAISEE